MHLLLALLLLASPAPSPSRAEPVRFSAPAFGEQVEVEVRGLPRSAADAAIQEALREVAALERTVDPGVAGSGVAALNAAAGGGPQAVDPRLSQLLARALDFCFWTEGAHGPLGRDLYRLWGLRAPAAALPDDPAREAAVTAASCSGLRYEPQKGTATLAAGAGIDLWGFAEGEAVDRAIEVLKRHKAPTGFVQIGSVRRGFGPGPSGKGWRVLLPVFEGLDQPLGEVWLRDQALAVASASHHTLGIGGDLYPPYLNQRTGKPSSGVLAAIAASELAVDALALSATAMVLSPHEAQLRLGALRPQPAVLWVLGTGQGAPLLLEYRWSTVPKK
ncbi:MAG TPA: FAD:protein FMN transferase [Thermoanaerobaculia bacterium]|jgi:thiamine biosynthesis lipoprotein|nr:FAD:protein FMN transferase [Thermoanaerobaculia bacterium]